MRALTTMPAIASGTPRSWARVQKYAPLTRNEKMSQV